ncbi:MAG: hypothetical protein NWE95_03185 [Candidatus Bathyarchaeota archaeon]|nr:hypothetical protein [Candidatus Bathyarchaeota archaeon]
MRFTTTIKKAGSWNLAVLPRPTLKGKCAVMVVVAYGRSKKPTRFGLKKRQ